MKLMKHLQTYEFLHVDVHKNVFHFSIGNSDGAEISNIVTTFHSLYANILEKILILLSSRNNYVFQSLFFLG
jgi:hypothetical protein